MFVLVSVVALLALIAIIILIAVIVWMKIQNKRISKHLTPNPARDNISNTAAAHKTLTVEYRNGRASSFENPVYTNRNQQGSESQQLRPSSQPEPRYTVEPTTMATTRYTVEPCGARYSIEPSSMTTIQRDNGIESEYRFEPVSPTKSMNCYAEIDQVERINMGIGGQCTRI